MSYRDNAIEVVGGVRMIQVWDAGHITRVVIKPTKDRRRCRHKWKMTVNSRGGWRNGCLDCGALAR